MVVTCYAALSVGHRGVSGCLSVGCNDVIPFFHLCLAPEPDAISDWSSLQNGMRHRIPAVLFRDDLHLGGALVGPSPVSHDEHTTLRSISAGLHMPALMALFSALAAVVSHIHQASYQPLFWLFLEKPLSKIAICMAYIPSSTIWCKLTILFILLVPLPYALEGLITFLVPDHPKVSSGIL